MVYMATASAGRLRMSFSATNTATKAGVLCKERIIHTISTAESFVRSMIEPQWGPSKGQPVCVM